MAKVTRKLTVEIDEDLFNRFEEARKRENRSRNSLLKEMFEFYFAPSMGEASTAMEGEK